MSYYGGFGGCNGILSGTLGLINGGAGYGGYGRCGMDNIFYYWRCCDYSPYECCVQLHTWLIVFIVLFLIGFFICLCACLAGCIYTARSKE